MPDLPGQTWLALAVLCFCVLTASGYILSSLLRDHYRVTTLKREVRRLRSEYDRRLKEIAAMNRGDDAPLGEVEIVDEPATSASKAA